jgi:hypothetical protein
VIQHLHFQCSISYLKMVMFVALLVHAPLRPRGIVAELDLPKGALLAHEWSFHVHQQSEPIDEFAPIQMQVRTSVPLPT